jgi:hypothetical protein
MRRSGASRSCDYRWTKKHGRSFFGYKNHVNADAKHKLIRHYAVTDAAVHDSQELDGLLDTGNTCNDVFADSAYRQAPDCQKAVAPLSSFHPWYRLSAAPGAGRPPQRALARIAERSHLDCRKPVRRFVRFTRVTGL